MSYDCYLKIDGITGSSTDDKNSGQIEVFSISWGAHNTSSVGSSGGQATAGKVSLSEISLMKKFDASSPILLQRVGTGEVAPKATIEFRKAGGSAGQKAFLTIELEKVLINSVNISGSSGGDDTPTESVSLAYGKITTNYFKQDEKGVIGSPIKGGWDQTKNVKV